MLRARLPGVVHSFGLAVLLLAAAAEEAPPPDVAIFANVRARELRFETVPEVTVTFTDGGRNQTVWKSDRDNLPETVQPRVTYRDIGIRLTITSTLPDIEKILDEALGPASKPPER